jgi:hypothetical protein
MVITEPDISWCLLLKDVHVTITAGYLIAAESNNSSWKNKKVYKKLNKY